MIHETISIPAYVLKHAPKYLSDFEFRLMLNMMNARFKRDWENVASRMGYENTGPITTALNKLADKVIVNKYTVDFTPLFNKCLQDECPEFQLECAVVEKTSIPKSPRKSHEFYVLWGDMCNLAMIAGDKNNWAKQILPKLEFERIDILGYCKYIESWYNYQDRNKPSRTSMIYPNVSQLRVNIQKWIDGGRKEIFIVPKTTFDFSEDSDEE